MPAPATLKIFVIDDDDCVRESLRALLEAQCYCVEDFSSGQDFLRRVDGKHADCVLMDVTMPQMTGLEVVEALRRRGDITPVILMTGAINPMIDAQARAMGVPLLDKPIQPGILATALQRAVAGHRP